MNPAKKILLAKRDKPFLSPESAVSSGSTLLNLACTDRPDVAFVKGGYYLMCGDSEAGKTWLALNILAEASINPAFDNYKLVFDDVEGGALMDLERYFGKELKRRIQSPAKDKHGPVNSDTVQSLYYHIADLIDEGDPFIYVCDSQDALDSDEAIKKFSKQKKADEEEEEAKGSYGDGKAKYHSQHLRTVLGGAKKLKSIIIFLSQTRDNIGFGSMFDPKVRSGGKAMKFYAHLEIWLSVKSRLKRKVRGKDRSVGIRAKAEIKKNRFTGKGGKDRHVFIPIYHDYGIDDLGSCVDYLIGEGHWEEIDKENKKPVYDAHDIMFQGTRDKIIHYIEGENLENRVRKIVAKVWREIEAECEVQRKKRYD